MGRCESIREKIGGVFRVHWMDLIDESYRHAGHQGAGHSGGHYVLTLVSDDFDGMTLVERHQAVYQALGEEMKGEIHALSMKTLTPREWKPLPSSTLA